MSDPEREQQAREAKSDVSPSSEEDEGEDDDVPSPFDHPAFMPVVLWGAALYFGYDGWITQDPDLLDDRTFNQVGFGVSVLLALYFTIQALRDRRASRSE